MSTNPAYEQLLAIQERAAQILGAAAYFTGVEIFTERVGDLDQKIRTKLAKLGLCVIVMTPSFSVLQRQGQRVKIRARVIVEASETVLVNSGSSGSQKPSLAVVTAAALALDGQATGQTPHYSGPGAEPLNEYRLGDNEPVRLVPDPKLLVYHAELYVDTFLDR